MRPRADLIKHQLNVELNTSMIPRAGSLPHLARGAVLDARLRGARLDGAFNDQRTRLVMQALNGLNYDELSWLSWCVSRAAVRANDAQIYRDIAFDVELNRDRHRLGRHTSRNSSLANELYDPECPDCNPSTWRHYVYGD